MIYTRSSFIRARARVSPASLPGIYALALSAESWRKLFKVVVVIIQWLLESYSFFFGGFITFFTAPTKQDPDTERLCPSLCSRSAVLRPELITRKYWVLGQDSEPNGFKKMQPKKGWLWEPTFHQEYELSFQQACSAVENGWCEGEWLKWLIAPITSLSNYS